MASPPKKPKPDSVPSTRVLLSPHEVHLLTGFSVPQLELWRIKGIGPRWHKIGRLVKYTRSDLQHWLADQGITVSLEVEAA